MWSPLSSGPRCLVVDIGGGTGYGGNLPINTLTGIFPNGLPAIATAAVLGVLINLAFTIFKKPEAHGLETKA